MVSDELFCTAKVKSDFCVAYAVLRSDMCSFGAEFTQTCHPLFLKRVVEGIVAMRFAWVQNDEEARKGRERLRELLPGGSAGKDPQSDCAKEGSGRKIIGDIGGELFL